MNGKYLAGSVLGIILGLFLIALPSCDSSETSTDDFPGDPRILGMWEPDGASGFLLFDLDDQGTLSKVDFHYYTSTDEECWVREPWVVSRIDETSFSIMQTPEIEWFFEYSFDGDHTLRLLSFDPIENEQFYKRSDAIESDLVPRCVPEV